MLSPIHTLDLYHLGTPGAIASYLIPHKHGGVLVESGPGSTLDGLEAALSMHDMTFSDITDVFLTHIHLDHAGAAGFLARQGARIHVHPNGAPHMLNPEKLLSSVKRVYGDSMETLWGKFLPIPEESLCIAQDGDEVEITGLRIKVMSTPGHANHHNVYLFERTCFTGDIGGIRLKGLKHICLPTPPPEFHLEQWLESIHRLRQQRISQIAPTHFGLYDDVEWHLNTLEQTLEDIDSWIDTFMLSEPSQEALREHVAVWEQERIKKPDLPADVLKAYENANPPNITADGLYRYWHKHRQQARSI
ncbi:MAG: MBL fold metallo-hydrolase [Chloroflexota bacterium]